MSQDGYSQTSLAPHLPDPARQAARETAMAGAHQAATAILGAVASVVQGQHEAITMIGCALFSGGHALIEDSPGTGKTTLARAFATAVGGTFARIQGTVDLLPGDITGSSVWEPTSRDGGQGHFRFVPGPLFASIVLADELNRTPARTQSAFLEAMQEGAVTVDGVSHVLPDPFFVIATQNPQEQHGTFALPQAQLDRFTVSVALGPLDAGTEAAVVRDQLGQRGSSSLDRLKPLLGPGQLRQLQACVRAVHVADPVAGYAVRLAGATRSDPRLAQGISTRAVIAWLRAAQVHALIQGRDYTRADDVKAVAQAVMGHRLLTSWGSTGGTGGTGATGGIGGIGGTGVMGAATRVVIAELLERVPVTA